MANQPNHNLDLSKEYDAVISGRWVLPVDQNQSLLENHSVVVLGNQIAAVIPTADIDSIKAKKHYDLSEHMIMPGLVNCHGHAAMTLFRGMADDLPLMTWLEEHIWPAEGANVSAEFVREGTELAIAEMIKSGTTCFSDMYFFPEEGAKAAESAGMRARLYTPILDFPTPYGSGPDEYIEKTETLIDQYQDHELISIGLGPHAPYTVSDEPFKKIKEVAKRTNAPVQIHLHETAFEVQDAVEKTGKRPTERLQELDILNRDLQAVHVTQANELDRKILSENHVSVVHCPESNLKLASGFSPIQAMIKDGINVCLGTDGAASNNDLDMFGEMRTMAMLAKAVAQDAAAVPAHQAIEIATINGAKALGMEDQIGSLEPGKYADLIAIDFSTLESHPVYDPVSHLVYTNMAPQVTHSWIHGLSQMEDRKLLNMDEEKLKAIGVQWQQKIRSKAQ